MTTQHPIPPNVVRFLRPRVRMPCPAAALVNVSAALALLAPLNQSNAVARFNADQAGLYPCVLMRARVLTGIPVNNFKAQLASWPVC